ncbi:MAG: hypothetical protein DMG53_22425 [Acidobacteria bacterium]|nr:MAG: hypothetical protein DMG53_22425 [Acidobacteriota bacterium]
MNEQPVLSHSADAALNVQIREYLDLVRRRKSWILLICLGISVCIAVVAMRLPNVYRAEATILVNPPKVNENFVTTMGENSGARLSTVRREVMSPTRLGNRIVVYREEYQGQRTEDLPNIPVPGDRTRGDKTTTRSERGHPPRD